MALIHNQTKKNVKGLIGHKKFLCQRKTSQNIKIKTTKKCVNNDTHIRKKKKKTPDTK